jgi:hypothetical protein
MLPSEVLCPVVLLRTEVLEEIIASIINVTRIIEQGRTLVVANNGSTLRRKSSSAASYC